MSAHELQRKRVYPNHKSETFQSIKLRGCSPNSRNWALNSVLPLGDLRVD